jgi:hypothetical protein
MVGVRDSAINMILIITIKISLSLTMVKKQIGIHDEGREIQHRNEKG